MLDRASKSSDDLKSLGTLVEREHELSNALGK